jgi:hypothetical protein
MAGSLETIHPRHSDVQQHYLRLQRRRLLDRLYPVGRFTNHLVVIVPSDHSRQPVPGQLFIIYDEHLHQLVSSSAALSG